jgi:beta-lactamase regulating signal transducer with metallopeptidase domain
MTLASLAIAAGRAAIILAFVLAAVRLLARASAGSRRSLLVAGFAIVLVLPIATAVLPALHLRDAATASADPTARVAGSTADELDRADLILVPGAARVAHEARPVAGVPDEAAASISPLVVLLGVWALGAIVVLARLGVGLARARRLVKSARFVETLDVGGRPVEVRVSRSVDTPAVTGLLVPVVLLPHDAETWSTERRRVVLAHELAHVANRDVLASVVAQLAVAIHWFDPLVWLAARRLRIERELAADARVLDHGVLPSSYAEHLLALATIHHDRPIAFGVLAMAEPAQVATRIRALLAPRTRTRFGRVRFALAGAGLSIAALVACATPERDEAPAPVAIGAPAQATIDPAVQRIVEDELETMTKDWAPCASIVLVLDPHTGAVVGAGYRGGTETTAQLAAARPIIPGSTMKPLVIAAALEEGAIKPTDRFDATPQLMSTIKDSTPHGMLDVGEILTVSSNVGLTRIFDKLGAAKLVAWTKRFHLAAAPSTLDATTGPAVAIGANLSSTPLEMAAAFAALANAGVYHAPTFGPDRDAGERVVRADTAATVLGLLEGVTGDQGTGKAARVTGVRVAGKTGTAPLGKDPNTHDYYASFVGTAPLDHPRYVIFVGAETPRDGGTGGQVAAPVFGRVMTRLLAR